MQSNYVFREELEHILAALTVPNRLAMELSLQTGLRIGDILAIKTEQLASRFTVREAKTGKNKRVYVPADMLERLRSISGRIYVFENRLNRNKHRTRQAVFKDLKRAAALFRIDKRLIISPHSARKVYAVDMYHKYGDIEKIKNLLNHSSEAVTIIYAMADIMTEKRLGK